MAHQLSSLKEGKSKFTLKKESLLPKKNSSGQGSMNVLAKSLISVSYYYHTYRKLIL